MTASSSDDRTDQVADAAPAAPKKTPARKTTVKKTTGTRTPSKAAAEKAAATVEVVAEPALKIDRSPESAGPRTAAPKKTTTAAARAAAAKNSTRDTTARAAAAKTASARSAATKTAAAKAAAAKAAAAKTTAAAGSESTASAAKAASAKTAAAKAAAEKSAAAKSAARTSAARAAAAKAAAAKTAAAKAAAAKAAAAEAEEAEAAEVGGVAVDPVAADANTMEADARESDVSGSNTTEATVEEPVEVAVETRVEPEPQPLTTESSASSDVLAVDGEDEAPTLESAPLEDTTTEAAMVTESTEEPSVDENATSGVVDAVSDSDETDEAIGEVGAASGSEAIRIRGLVKSFGDHTAVNGIDLTIPAGSFYGIVGPNGAGKTTTLSIVAGLLRADAGDIAICGVDQSAKPLAAKRMMGVLPDRLRTFDRLTGRQLLYYYGLLRGLASAVIEKRVADLARAFDLGEALNRVVSDYSAGMTKKIMLAGAMIHSPRVLVLDEPFEAVDPVSSAVILDILRAYVSHGGTVVLSSHGMDLVERVCSRVAIIVGGEVLAEGTIDEVRAGQTLEARFVELSGGIGEVEGLEWLHTFSD
ncbi:ABC transporter ATP-binding protein [Microbacterium foliorum]|nr:ABC transporter ATP-binding protein [Microbacterium foliorum]